MHPRIAAARRKCHQELLRTSARQIADTIGPMEGIDEIPPITQRVRGVKREAQELQQMEAVANLVYVTSRLLGLVEVPALIAACDALRAELATEAEECEDALETEESEEVPAAAQEAEGDTVLEDGTEAPAETTEQDIVIGDDIPPNEILEGDDVNDGKIRLEDIDAITPTDNPVDPVGSEPAEPTPAAAQEAEGAQASQAAPQAPFRGKKKNKRR